LPWKEEVLERIEEEEKREGVRVERRERKIFPKNLE
jgi:hypothetical protein